MGLDIELEEVGWDLVEDGSGCWELEYGGLELEEGGWELEKAGSHIEIVGWRLAKRLVSPTMWLSSILGSSGGCPTSSAAATAGILSVRGSIASQLLAAAGSTEATVDHSATGSMSSQVLGGSTEAERIAWARSLSRGQTYVCPVCQKVFGMKYYYERHLKCHASSKEHQCPYCSFNCAYKWNLKSHVRNKHRDKPPPP
ncbi:unnamed protein product, partial [Meganyctiphanes norvegica]